MINLSINQFIIGNMTHIKQEKKIDKEIREILSTLILLYRFVPSHVLYITRGCCNKHVQFACLYMICCIINDDDDDDENTQKPTSARGGCIAVG